MNDLVVVELSEDLEKIAAANSYSGATGEWLGVLNDGELVAQSDHKMIVLMVDGRLVAMHQVSVPDLADAKLIKILPGLVSEKLAINAQENQFSLAGQYGTEAGWRTVCAIEKKSLATLLDRANALGIRPDIVVPDFMLMEQPGHGCRMIALPDRYVVRTASGEGFSGEQNIVDTIIGGADDVQSVKPDNWRRNFGKTATLGGNFLHGKFAKKANWAANFVWWKRAIYLVFSTAILYTSLYYYNAVQNFQSIEKLYAESESLFRAALPDEPRIVNMEAQLRRAVIARQQNGGGEFFALFAPAVQAIMADKNASIETARYEEDDSELLLTVSFSSFAEAAKFNDFLSSKGMQVEEGSSRQEAGRIFADLRVRRQ